MSFMGNGTLLTHTTTLATGRLGGGEVGQCSCMSSLGAMPVGTKYTSRLDGKVDDAFLASMTPDSAYSDFTLSRFFNRA